MRQNDPFLFANSIWISFNKIKFEISVFISRSDFMVSHGGKRDGAGRKSTGRSRLVLYVSSEEAEACKAIV